VDSRGAITNCAIFTGIPPKSPPFDFKQNRGFLHARADIEAARKLVDEKFRRQFKPHRGTEPATILFAETSSERGGRFSKTKALSKV
jgi:hypothetical protein